MTIVLDGTTGITGMPAIYENAVSSATAATGTVNFDVLTQSVLQYTTNASGNWTINIRGNSSTTLDSLLSTGQSVTVTFLVTQGSTAYYNNAVQIDGASVTPKWQGGTAPSAGNASSVDVYTYAIIKTGSAAYSVYASVVKFA
jgi:VCBS repeat-containing protein